MPGSRKQRKAAIKASKAGGKIVSATAASRAKVGRLLEAKRLRQNFDVELTKLAKTILDSEILVENNRPKDFEGKKFTVLMGAKNISEISSHTVSNIRRELASRKLKVLIEKLEKE